MGDSARSRYVPPHLRGAGGGGDGGGGNSQGPPPGGDGGGPQGGGGGGGGYGGGGGGGGAQGRWNNGGGGGDGGGRGGGGGGGGRWEQPQPSNHRWNDRGGGGDYGGGGGGGRSYGGGGGGRGGRYGGASVNAKGYHGDMRPDPRLEKQLFQKADHQQQGINFDKYDDIPVETSGENVPEPIETFPPDVLGPELTLTTELCGYSKPTPVQKYSIPIGITGRDLMACAQTGSGKTAGFLFPTLISLLRQGGPEYPQDGNSRFRRTYPVGLVLAPTRELASQIYDEARRFCYLTGVQPTVIYGGADVKSQLRELERGCDLLVATPGRLVDFLERGKISLKCIRFLVLDEADRMLDMGFEPQIRRIVEQEDMARERQTFMFSATFPQEIQRLASDFMRDYIFLAVGRVGSASKDVIQKVVYCEENDKLDHLIRTLNSIESGLVLVFVETKRNADWLEYTLCKEGFPASSIHGDKTQREREDALRLFKHGTTPILAATDVAARGLDINNVTQVINYDLPNNVDDYVHRIGRTGRVGNVGNALSFMNEKNRNVARDLYELLAENDQETPTWLASMSSSSFYGGGGGRRGGRGGKKGNFGARDYRNEGGGGGGGSRGGGGGGGPPRGGGGGYSGGGGGYGGGGYGGGGYGGGGYGGGGGGGNYQDNSAW